VAFVPLSIAAGEAYQFDWSHEIMVINGAATIVKVADMRLCHSRMSPDAAVRRQLLGAMRNAHGARLSTRDAGAAAVS
jgi:hypothetical protein